jgi:uncharacterized protein
MIRGLWMLLPVAGLALAAASAFQAEIAEWRRTRETTLTSDTGWTTLTGLHWLREGKNSFGREATADIPLADGPQRAGAFERRNRKVTVTMDGKSREVAHDSADFVQNGRLKLYVIERGDKIGIRVRDPESPYRRGFHGIQNFPALESYRVTARFVAEPRKIPILNVLDQIEPSECPGYVVFSLRGREYKLYPIIETPGDQRLFYIFRDGTSGKETYGAGRFLYSDLPKDGKVTLDFNKAYNPPCAFTPYATCPLPPKENRLAVRIEAGEKAYHFE